MNTTTARTCARRQHAITSRSAYTCGIYGRGAASGVYKVTQLLPSESDDCQYRIKSSDEPHERVVKESELSRDSWVRPARIRNLGSSAFTGTGDIGCSQGEQRQNGLLPFCYPTR